MRGEGQGETTTENVKKEGNRQGNSTEMSNFKTVNLTSASEAQMVPVMP